MTNNNEKYCKEKDMHRITDKAFWLGLIILDAIKKEEPYVIMETLKSSLVTATIRYGIEPNALCDGLLKTMINEKERLEG